MNNDKMTIADNAVATFNKTTGATLEMHIQKAYRDDVADAQSDPATETTTFTFTDDSTLVVEWEHVD